MNLNGNKSKFLSFLNAELLFEDKKIKDMIDAF